MHASTGRPIVEVDDLSKKFRLFTERHQSVKQALLRGKRAEADEFWALQNVSFDVYEGETVGIIGHNGSGKSTMLKCLTNILQPDQGRVAIHGSASALLELGAGFHPELTGRENIFLNAAILGVPRREIAARFDDIVSFAGLEPFIDTPVKNFSSGMYVRLGFAVAINVQPDVLIIDEVLAVGDAEFQRRCIEKVGEFRRSGGTIVFVSHSMPDVVRICDRVVWLHQGQVRALGSTAEVTEQYLNSTELRSGVTIDGSHRWGSGEIRVAEVALLDADGIPAESIQAGDPLTMEITVESSEPIEQPEIGFSIYDQDAHLITSLSTRTRNVDTGLVDGRRRFRFSIDRLPLNEGHYEVTFTIVDHTGYREFDVCSRYLRFDVRHGHDRDRGPLSIGGNWHVEAAPASN